MELTKLQNRVERMLDGEKKRREIALKFIDEVEKILLPVAGHIFPLSGYDNTNAATFVSNTSLYFRWSETSTQTNIESPGFYFDEKGIDAYWGTPLAQIYGIRFWRAIRTIVEWIPKVVELIDRKEKSREDILALLK